MNTLLWVWHFTCSFSFQSLQDIIQDNITGYYLLAIGFLRAEHNLGCFIHQFIQCLAHSSCSVSEWMNPDYVGKEMAAQRDKSSSLEVTYVFDSGFEDRALPLLYSASYHGAQHINWISSSHSASTRYKTRLPLKRAIMGKSHWPKFYDMLPEDSRITMCPQGLPSCKIIYAHDRKGRCIRGNRVGTVWVANFLLQNFKCCADIFRIKKKNATCRMQFPNRVHAP